MFNKINFTYLIKNNARSFPLKAVVNEQSFKKFIALVRQIFNCNKISQPSSKCNCDDPSLKKYLNTEMDTLFLMI